MASPTNIHMCLFLTFKHMYLPTAMDTGEPVPIPMQNPHDAPLAESLHTGRGREIGCIKIRHVLKKEKNPLVSVVFYLCRFFFVNQHGGGGGFREHHFRPPLQAIKWRPGMGGNMIRSRRKRESVCAVQDIGLLKRVDSTVRSR